mmetsp:Transcript_8149/g.22082  ORF Transcript_8149/g.22082 Transcript_8149/m.22082 type:complete len:234 (+) Transcript_8149:73-774(+)
MELPAQPRPRRRRRGDSTARRVFGMCRPVGGAPAATAARLRIISCWQGGGRPARDCERGSRGLAAAAEGKAEVRPQLSSADPKLRLLTKSPVRLRRSARLAARTRDSCRAASSSLLLRRWSWPPAERPSLGGGPSASRSHWSRNVASRQYSLSSKPARPAKRVSRSLLERPSSSVASSKASIDTPPSSWSPRARTKLDGLPRRARENTANDASSQKASGSQLLRENMPVFSGS